MFKGTANVLSTSPLKWKHISFGCTALDRLTNGLPTRGITEISGEAGVGKSQICMQLSLAVQLPESMGGLGKATVYICTEDIFPSKRLAQMIESFTELYKQRNTEFSNNIFIEHIGDTVSKIFPKILSMYL